MSDLVTKDKMDIGLSLGSFEIDPMLLGGTAQVVSLGTKVGNRFLEKYKGKEGIKDRIAFITTNPVVIKFHYIPDVGYIQCFGGACCEEDESEAKVRYLFPIIQYKKVEGKKLTEAYKYEVKVLSAGADLYENIVNNHESLIEDEIEGGIVGVDFNVTCTDENYQKLTLIPAKASLWKSNEEIISFLKESWENIVKHLAEAVARPMTAEKFAKVMNHLTAAEVDEDDEDVEDAQVLDKKSASDYLDEDEE